jgi:adenine-specific DNA-methyltransferase
MRQPELTWIGKADRTELKRSTLREVPTRSYSPICRIQERDRRDNRLVFGDNLLALRVLEAEFAGQVKCCYVDPPYNTGNAFQHYDDGLEHSLWLGMIRDRLEVLRSLLSPNGFCCCHIDDSESHYLKVVLDEVFGRQNYLATLYIQVRYPEKTLKQDMAFHKEIEQIHIYRKGPAAVPIQNQRKASFDKFRHYVRELGQGRQIGLGGKKVTVFGPVDYQVSEEKGSDKGLKEIWASGTILDGNSSGRFYRDYLAGRVSIDGLSALYKVEGIGNDRFGYRYFTGPKRTGATKGKYYQGVPLTQLEQPDLHLPAPIENFYDFAAQFGNCRHEGGVQFRSGKKPELLLHTLLKHFSQPGDLVLDCFAGSGTTGAVAHKMDRRWIMIESGEHCHTHILPRMKKVIDGEDTTGVTEVTGWKGGGGFRYYGLHREGQGARGRGREVEKGVKV